MPGPENAGHPEGEDHVDKNGHSQDTDHQGTDGHSESDGQVNVCENPDCEKSATRHCPKCVSLGLRPAFFCSQVRLHVLEQLNFTSS